MNENIAKALVQAQKGFAPALKSSTNPHFRSKYADLSACVEAVIDSLNANGIALVQMTKPSDNGVVVETVFVHESGETLNCGELHVPASKNDAQGYGSALTYARRYSLMAACGIAPEDDDGNAASKRPKEPAKITPRAGSQENVDPDMQIWISDKAKEIKVLLAEGKMQDAYDAYVTAHHELAENADWGVTFTDKFEARERTALKKHKEFLEMQRKQHDHSV